jgi:preprotein translocase subunit SecE
VKRLFNYIAESRIELTKVTWPSRKQATRLTIAVVVFSLAMAAFIGALDRGLNEVLQRFILKG